MLKDILATNFSFEKIKKALEEKMSDIKEFNVRNAMALFLVPKEEEKKETDDEKKIRIGFPDNDIWMLLQEHGC
jgi:hypothetical protein